ncbi:PP2C family serine/threonine-protein phosphatase, partial [uncultured Arcanobacterium sp.]|uniref:PP2C family protein-serine/threonine phosphatase n=1 Tax=uncultured Arcanobacterium sp. TaxID=487520 RepID=UPI00263128D6
MAIKFLYAAYSDIGLIRKSNQDSGYASENLLVVADGMGGAAAGDIASSVTVAHLSLNDDVYPADDLLRRLHNSLQDAHEDLIMRTAVDSSLSGMGTTCVAILRSGNKLAMVHIGDSRAYLLRKEKLTQVTHDHTLVQYLVDRGKLTPEEARHHPKRNVIMRALGDSPEELELDESLREAKVGDRWLLCSDGLFGVVSEEMLQSTLSSYSDPDECAQHLVSLALAGGAPDNVTVIIADVVEAETADSLPQKPLIVGAACANPVQVQRNPASAAEKALSLLDDSSPALSATPPKRPRRARIAALVGALLVLGGGSGAGYMWTQSQYFVAPAGEYVAIYKGIPQKVGPLHLSSLHTKT